MRIIRMALVLVLFTTGNRCEAQMKKFVAPVWADTIRNPLKGNALAMAEGKVIYQSYCSPCHGTKGKGDGVAAAGLDKPPADHTSRLIQKQTDGAFFWMIQTGNNPMPNYKGVLNTNQIWELVNYIRSLGKQNKNR
jgi:mono/diheme cytochrome c family protein